MILWIIEPRDPLIVRDGRPFGPEPGARATTLAFPFPSTLVGALRHKAGLSADGQFDRAQIGTVLTYGIHGPLLVELDDDDRICKWLLPAPADALLLDPEPRQDGRARLRWLAPRALVGSPVTNLPDDLFPIGPAMHEPNKASGVAPHFWYQDAFRRWLRAPQDDEDSVALAALGIPRLASDTRMHVSIDPATQTARERMLFQTSGLEFTWRDQKQAQGDEFITKRLALAVWFDGDTPHFENGLAPMGGERRLMRWHIDRSGDAPCDESFRRELFQQIEAEQCCRVVLLTPAWFAAGYRPSTTWIRGGVPATVVGAAVQRPKTVSGWDLAAKNGKGEPKPTLRLAPAGSVYYVEFPDQTNISAWLTATWMCNVSDDARVGRLDQHRLDGFGLAVVGAWPRTRQEQQG